MFGTQDLAIFIVSGLLLNIAPGPDSLFIMARSAVQGWRAGSIAALGIGSGTLVHIFAAALGISAIIATSSNAFLVLKCLGAIYLVYIGIRLVFSKQNLPEESASSNSKSYEMSYRKIYIQGFLTNVLNPKVAVFFLAFVPQFISPDATHKSLAFITLGLIFNFNGMLWCHFLAISTAFASKKIQIGNLVASWLNKLTGVIFVSLGIKLAFAQQS
jgi:threonine/homoserine/homoserine lactone efflux protein